ncbi:MAG TPA: cytochrome c maturation protein CcmE [Acidobacteriota bacterium]|nr:cytochrome c maturation protein CcmE [Acidobacteriota bacterium]
MKAQLKFILGGIVIVAALAWMGFIGFQESKAYYITVDEFSSMRENLAGKNLRLAGEVVEGSIDRTKPQMEFVIAGPEASIMVRYLGNAVIPDTFTDGSTALVEGTIASDGVFEARRIQAKCASRYEAEYAERTAS